MSTTANIAETINLKKVKKSKSLWGHAFDSIRRDLALQLEDEWVYEPSITA